MEDVSKGSRTKLVLGIRIKMPRDEDMMTSSEDMLLKGEKKVVGVEECNPAASQPWTNATNSQTGLSELHFNIRLSNHLTISKTDSRCKHSSILQIPIFVHDFCA